MTIEIRMPALGQTTNEVRLLRWLVVEGDEIRKGDTLCEVETDKVVMPLESAASGTVLKRLIEEETTVSAGNVIAILGEMGEIPTPETHRERSASPENTSASADEAASSAIVPISNSEARSKPGGRSAQDEIRASPVVRNMAAKHGLDLYGIIGTGPKGLITREDLRRVMDETGAVDISLDQAAPRMDLPIALSDHQQAVARSLIRSKIEAPHYYLTCTVEADPLLTWREENRHPDGSKVSFYALFAFAASQSLTRHPRVNARYIGGKLQTNPEIRIGVAVAVEDELFVPVLRDATGRGIFELDTEIDHLVLQMQRGKKEMGMESGGTITLSNLGMYPIDVFSPIINPPQAVILGFGRTRKELHIQDDGNMRIRTVLSVTGSFDHRVVNGAQGATFLGELKQVLEKELDL